MKKNADPNSQLPASNSQPGITTITSFAQLKARLEKPLICRFVLSDIMADENGRRPGDPVAGEVIDVPVRRLPPSFVERIQALRREVIPPRSKPRSPGEEAGYNYDDPGYKLAAARMEVIIRAMTVYEGCPIVQQGFEEWKTAQGVPIIGQRLDGTQPERVERERIADFVQSFGTQTVLNMLYIAISQGGVTVWEQVNFTLPPGLPES